MKKLLFSILMIFFLANINISQAKTFDLSTGADLTSGNTTVVDGGVSTFVLEGVADSYDLHPQLNRYYALGFALSNLMPSQAALALGNWSGVTFSVFGKFKSNDSTVPWDAIEPVYFIKDEAADSSTSPYPRWINVPPADLVRIYFVSEGGNTAYGLATGKLIASEIPLEVTEPLVVLSEGNFTMEPAYTGASTFTVGSIGAWPSGGKWVEIQPVTGTSIYITTDNVTTPSPSTGFAIYASDPPVGFFDQMGRMLRLHAGAEENVCRYRILNRKP